MSIYFGNTPIDSFNHLNGVSSVWLGSNKLFPSSVSLTYSGGSKENDPEYLASYIVDENGNEYYGNETTINLPINTELTIMGKSMVVPTIARFKEVNCNFNNELTAYASSESSQSGTLNFVPMLTFKLVANTTIELVYSNDSSDYQVYIEDGGEPLFAFAASDGDTDTDPIYVSSYIEDSLGNIYTSTEDEVIHLRKNIQLTIKGKSGVNGSYSAAVQVMDMEEEEYVGVPSSSTSSFTTLYTFTATDDFIAVQLAYEDVTESGTIDISLYRMNI